MCMAYEEMKDIPGYRIPDAITSRPELGLIDSYYLQEFYTLGTERVNAMSEGAIPVTKIRKRAEQIQEDDIEMYEQIMLTIDRIYLNLRYIESERKRNAEKK